MGLLLIMVFNCKLSHKVKPLICRLRCSFLQDIQWVDVLFKKPTLSYSETFHGPMNNALPDRTHEQMRMQEEKTTERLEIWLKYKQSQSQYNALASLN